MISDLNILFGVLNIILNVFNSFESSFKNSFSINLFLYYELKFSLII